MQPDRRPHLSIFSLADALRIRTTAPNRLGRHKQLLHQVFLEARIERLLFNCLGHTSKPLIALRCGNRKVGMNPGNADGAIFLVVEFRTAQPTAKKSSELIARHVLVLRVHGVDCGETLIGTHTIEELVDELSNASLAARRLKRSVACAVRPVRMRIHPGTLLES